MNSRRFSVYGLPTEDDKPYSSPQCIVYGHQLFIPPVSDHIVSDGIAPNTLPLDGSHPRPNFNVNPDFFSESVDSDDPLFTPNPNPTQLYSFSDPPPTNPTPSMSSHQDQRQPDRILSLRSASDFSILDPQFNEPEGDQRNEVIVYEHSQNQSPSTPNPDPTRASSSSGSHTTSEATTTSSQDQRQPDGVFHSASDFVILDSQFNDVQGDQHIYITANENYQNTSPRFLIFLHILGAVQTKLPGNHIVDNTISGTVSTALAQILTNICEWLSEHATATGPLITAIWTSLVFNTIFFSAGSYLGRQVEAIISPSCRIVIFTLTNFHIQNWSLVRASKVLRGTVSFAYTARNLVVESRNRCQTLIDCHQSRISVCWSLEKTILCYLTCQYHLGCPSDLARTPNRLGRAFSRESLEKKRALTATSGLTQQSQHPRPRQAPPRPAGSASLPYPLRSS